jgi:hypothetical protein
LSPVPNRGARPSEGESNSGGETGAATVRVNACPSACRPPWARSAQALGLNPQRATCARRARGATSVRARSFFQESGAPHPRRA